MDYRQLVNRLEAIQNRVDEADDARAQYDKFKADDARAAAVERVKKLASTPLQEIPRLGDAIDPKTGILYYGDAAGEIGNVSPKKYPYKWLQKGGPGESQQLAQLIQSAGLKIVPHVEKTLFGTAEYGKVEPEKLADLISGIEAVKPTDSGQGPKPAGKSPSELAELMEKLKKLSSLVDQYVAKKQPKAESISIAASLKESFGYVAEGDITHAAAAGAGGYAAGKLASKIAGRTVPGLSMGLDAYDAYDRWKEGDYVGSGLSAGGAALGWLPVVGQAASLGAMAVNAGRDIKAGKYDELGGMIKNAAVPTVGKNGRSSQSYPPMKPGGDPSVYVLQKKLAAKGATNLDGTPLIPDGYQSKDTSAAMQKFPNVKEGVQ